MLNFDLVKIKQERIKYKQKLVYIKIFNNLCQTINVNIDSGNIYCLFIVPEFILDEITYPFIDCIKYLNYKLNKIKQDKNIIEISFYIPNVYYIKWII